MKKAFLVHFEITTRVVIDTETVKIGGLEDKIIEAGVEKTRELLEEKLISDNCVGFEADEAIPYDPKRDGE